MLYMLDTNIVSDMMRHPTGITASRIADADTHTLCLSIITAAELRFGAAKKGSSRLSSRIEAILSRIKILPFDAPADAHYAAIRMELEAAGRPIGPNDLLIAAHARSIDATMVTANVAEFGRVRNLTVEDWTKE